MAYDREARKLQNSKESSAAVSDTKRPSRYAPSKNRMKEGEQAFVQEPNKPLALFKKERGRVYKTYLSSDGNQIVDKNLSVGGNSTFTGIVDILNTTDSSDDSGDTGALRIEGGVSVAKKLYVGTDLDVNGTTNLDDVDIDGNVDINGTISASAIYQHTGNTDTNITFATNSIGFYQAHANAGGEASFRINSEGVIVNPIGEAGIDFRVESDGVVKCLYVDSTYNSVQIGGGSALQGSPSGGMFIHNGTTPSAHTDDTVYIGAKDTTTETSNDGSTLSIFCEADADDSGTPSNLNNFNAKIGIHINGKEYWLWLQDPSP